MLTSCVPDFQSYIYSNLIIFPNKNSQTLNAWEKLYKTNKVEFI
jgi:hypothetical protein